MIKKTNIINVIFRNFLCPALRKYPFNFKITKKLYNVMRIDLLKISRGLQFGFCLKLETFLNLETCLKLECLQNLFKVCLFACGI